MLEGRSQETTGTSQYRSLGPAIINEPASMEMESVEQEVHTSGEIQEDQSPVMLDPSHLDLSAEEFTRLAEGMSHYIMWDNSLELPGWDHLNHES